MEMSIIVDNITNTDVSKKLLRIVKRNTFLFPEEIQGESKTYLLTFNYQSIQHDAKYTIGSRDGRQRSGVLRLGKGLYEEIGINAGDKLKISFDKDDLYAIEKL